MFDTNAINKKHLHKSQMWDVLKVTGLSPLKKSVTFKTKNIGVFFNLERLKTQQPDILHAP